MPIAVPLKSWLLWPPPFGYYPAALGPLGLFPVFFKFVSYVYTIVYKQCYMYTYYITHLVSPARIFLVLMLCV